MDTNQPVGATETSGSKKLIIGIVVVLVVIFGGYFYFQNRTSQSVSTEPIKLGFVGPLTGDAAVYGETEKNTINLALQEINTGNELNRKLEVIYEDGKCNGKDAVTAAQKLINVDKVKIILGGFCSAETLGVAPLAEENKVILFSSFSSSPAITNAGDYIFRNSPSDADVARADAEFIVAQGVKTIAIITENTDYSQGVRGVMRRVFEQGGMTVNDEIFNSGEKDFRTILVKVKSFNPQAIYINVGTSPAIVGVIVKQIRELNMGNTKIFSNYLASNADILSVNSQAMERLVYSDFKDVTEFVGKLLEKYKAEFKKDPAHVLAMAARYDSVYIIKNAIKQCNGDSSDCIKKYLYNMPEYNGTFGKYRLDSNGDILLSGDFIIHKEIKNGKPVIIR